MCVLVCLYVYQRKQKESKSVCVYERAELSVYVWEIVSVCARGGEDSE